MSRSLGMSGTRAPLSPRSRLMMSSRSTTFGSIGTLQLRRPFVAFTAPVRPVDRFRKLGREVLGGDVAALQRAYLGVTRGTALS